MELLEARKLPASREESKKYLQKSNNKTTKLQKGKLNHYDSVKITQNIFNSLEENFNAW